MGEEDEGRLRRWSRLKQEGPTKPGRGGARPVAIAEPSSSQPVVAGGANGTDVAALTGGDLPAEPGVEPDATAEADLPPIDSLDADSDYTPFLGKDVPQHLARAALRKLWLSDPALAGLDGLNDYDEDFTIIEKIATGLAAGKQLAKDESEAADDSDEEEAGDSEDAPLDEEAATDTGDGAGAGDGGVQEAADEVVVEDTVAAPAASSDES